MFKASLPPAILRPRGARPRIRIPTTTPNTPTSNPAARRFHSTNPATTQSRADKILTRLPKSMQKYTSRLRGAPISHVVAFLILHEITAVVPLVALFGLFHCTDYVPLGYMMENYGGSVREGVGRFERYFSRKGWFGFGAADADADAAVDVGAGKAAGGAGEDGEAAVMKRWESSDDKYRIVVEVGLAYAITKVLLPLRILASVWATPWFAGGLGRIRGAVSLTKKK
ncbi:unnamed protein product [Discula destructiva]